MKRGQSFHAKAVAAWAMLPDWVEALALACDRETQASVARRLDVNAAYVSYAINGDKFPYHRRVEEAVRARLMGETIACPVLDDIGADRCGELRRARRRPIGPVEKTLRATCPTCPHNPGEEEVSDDCA